MVNCSSLWLVQEQEQDEHCWQHARLCGGVPSPHIVDWTGQLDVVSSFLMC